MRPCNSASYTADLIVRFGYVPFVSCQRRTEPISSRFMSAPMLESYGEPVPQSPEYMALYGVALVPGFGALTAWLSGWKASMTCCPGQVAPGMVISWTLFCHGACGNRWSLLDIHIP